MASYQKYDRHAYITRTRPAIRYKSIRLLLILAIFYLAGLTYLFWKLSQIAKNSSNITDLLLWLVPTLLYGSFLPIAIFRTQANHRPPDPRFLDCPACHEKITYDNSLVITASNHCGLCGEEILKAANETSFDKAFENPPTLATSKSAKAPKTGSFEILNLDAFIKFHSERAKKERTIATSDIIQFLVMYLALILLATLFYSSNATWKSIIGGAFLLTLITAIIAAILRSKRDPKRAFFHCPACKKSTIQFNHLTIAATGRCGDCGCIVAEKACKEPHD